MTILINKLIYPMMSFAAGGEGHTHGENGETEHLYPVLMVFAVLVIGGTIFHFMSKKK